MSKRSTLNYLINSYNDGKKEVEILQQIEFEEQEMDVDEYGFEPSQGIIDAILSFASQYDVLKIGNVWNIEFNLN